MLRALTFCNGRIGCSNLVRSGRCPDCERQQRRTDNQTYQESLYRTARWRKFRARVLSEQPFCEDNGSGCTVLAEELHHKVKRADDLRLFYERSNVSPLCRPCHARRTRRGE